MVKIISDFGFCYGVEKAIEKLNEAGKSHPLVYLTHPLIHNLPENEALMKEAKAVFYDPAKEIDPDAAAVLSAHGHPLEEEAIFQGKCDIVDATCPLILQRYKLAEKREGEYSYLFLGKKNHQETIGFLSHFPYFELIDSTQDLLSQLKELHLKEHTLFIPQTTVSKESWNQVKTYLEARSMVTSLDICPLYEKRSRQAVTETKDLDPKTSYFIVCGDKASSNAKEIYAAIRQANPTLEGDILLDFASVDQAKIQGKNIYIASATSANKKSLLRLKRDLEAYLA